MPLQIAIKQRPQQLSSNKSALKCGSLLFAGGLQHEDGHLVPNAVARFGDDAEHTVFATLHDLRKVFETHEQLEQQKTEQQRGPPFVLFSNSDIGNLAKEQPPPDDYLQAEWDKAQPTQCQRPAGFNFREYCSTKREKDDPSMEQEGGEWNELRAVLNRDNMVGLLYIHDPKCSPEQHAEEARQLQEAFDSKYSMAVFQLKEQGGVQGDLLTTGTGSSGGSSAAGCGSSGGGGGSGSNAAGGSNGGVQNQGASMGQDPAEEEEDVDDVARDTDQQQARKKRRTAEGAGGGQEGGPRLLTFEEYLQQRAGKKKIAVSAL